MNFNEIYTVINDQIWELTKCYGVEPSYVFVSSDVYLVMKRNLLYSNYMHKDCMDFEDFLGLDVLELKDKSIKGFIHVGSGFKNKVGD